MRCALSLLLAISLTTCRLDRLITPVISDRLAVTPASLQASANFGSSVARAATLRIASADGATLSWTASATAPWLTLLPSSGGAPDTLLVTLRPNALSQTQHQDTIVFTSAQASGTVKVPVTFNILPPAPELDVSPALRDTAALARSVMPDTFSLRIKNTGGLPLDWTAGLDTGWVTLSDSGGTVPPQDSAMVLVTLRPDSLAAGTHRGAIAITAPSAIGSPDTVPVTFRIAPCAEPLVTLDALVTGSVTLRDCGAPQRPGRQARLYAVQASANDTLSFRLTAAFNAYLVLTNSAGTAIFDQNDECAGFTGTACITYSVTATGRYVIEATTAAAADTGAFTLAVVRERAPSTPQAIGQLRSDTATAIGPGVTTTESVVVLRGTIGDPNPTDSVRLMVELVGALSGPRTDSSAFVSAASGAVTVAVRAAGLIDNEAYRWRARACDRTGRCSSWLGFGNPDPEVDFYVNSVLQPPAPPGALNQFNGASEIPPGGGTGGSPLSTQTVTFRGEVTDPDPGDAIALEVEVKEVGVAFNGDATRGVAVSSGNTASVSMAIQAPLVGSLNFHWRARACDQTNRCGSWVSFGGPSETDTDFHVP